jgi:threonine dehydrogenase-like Zn-dependent dehydrogenase
MLAMDYRGPYRVRTEQKPIPSIQHPEDAIVRVTRSCICGSDLHLYHGLVPDTRVGMTFGHEFTGVVEEVGPEVRNLTVGDHVLVPFNIACGRCHFCRQGLFGNCHESNTQATAVGGIFGYSHTAGGYDGGQAEYVRVPYADVGPTKIPDNMDPDDAVLLTDVVPTGYQAAEMGGIRKGRHGRRLRGRPGRHPSRTLRLVVWRRAGDRHRSSRISSGVRPALCSSRGLQFSLA